MCAAVSADDPGVRRCAWIPFVVLLLTLAGCGGYEEPAPNEVGIEQIENAGGDPAQPHLISYFLVFDSDETARGAVADLKKHGFGVDADYTAAFAEDREGWRVVEGVDPLTELERTEALLADLADRHDGEYDGWESAP
jgi:regulator of RNase E activity RraB